MALKVALACLDAQAAAVTGARVLVAHDGLLCGWGRNLMPVCWRDIAAGAVDIAPRAVDVAANHGEEGAIASLLPFSVSQHSLANGWQPVDALDPIVHAASGQWHSMLSFAYGDRRW